MALSKIVENSISDGAVAAAKLKDFAAAVDLNGVELILDADQDTSITADTDDRIDFKIANVEHFSFSNSSGDTVVKPMVDGKDIIFQQYDGNKILEINDGNFVGVGGNSAGAGEIRIYEDTDNGNHYTGFKAGNNTASVAYVLPTADGSSGHALQTDGSGTLSWGAAGAITSYTNSTNNRVVTSVDSSTVNSEANLTFDGSTLAVTGAVTVSTNLDVDGTANLDAVDIDGAVQLDATLTIGANDQGYDVILYGDTASANVTWDTSADDLIFNGAAGLIVPDGQLTLGSTAVTSTAAELNLLDGVSGLVQADFTKLAAVDATAAELNIVDGGTSATSTTVADADRVVMNDNGTMVQVAVTDLAAYFDDEITAMPNLTSVGTLTALTVDDVAIDGKVMTMTGSSSDTAVFTAGTNGTLSIVTTDAAAAAANITITADGTAELAGTTVTLNSGGDIVLDADGADVVFKDGGTTIATHSNSSSDYVITTGVQDKDFVIKGNDGGATITPFTLDMSAGGDLFLTGGLIDLKNNGSNVSQIKFYCESSNAHAQTLIGAPHSESATNTLTLPSTGGDAYLVTTSSTATLTNKTLGAAGTVQSVGGIPFFKGDTGSIYTHDVSGTDDSAEYNTAYGLTTLDAVTTGDKNTAMGYGALGANTTGYNNTAIGHLAGLDITEGYQNTLVGDRAGTNITTGDNNTAIGQNAMTAVTTQNRNTAVGMDALKLGTNDDCTAIGAFALAANTNGADNTAVGAYALTANQSGGSNVAIGFDALKSNTTGNRNIVLGNEAMDASDTESDNMAIGHAAMTANNAGGVENIAIGNYSLDALTSGDGNVAVGYQALTSTDAGRHNVGVGYRTLYTTTGGDNNVALGKEALFYNSGGDENIAIGNQALTTNVSGSSSIAIGANALTSTTGSNNTAIGHNSGNGLTTGQTNVLIGYNTDTSANHVNNGICIGSDITTEGNRFSFGKPSNVVYNDFGSNNSWTRSSDERKKTNIQDATLGLDFINDLRTITYKWKRSQDIPNTLADYDANTNHMNTDITMHGMLAQEVKAALDTAGVTTFGGWAEESDGSQSLSQEMFIYPLIKAVQELSAKVKALEDA